MAQWWSPLIEPLFVLLLLRDVVEGCFTRAPPPAEEDVRSEDDPRRRSGSSGVPLAGASDDGGSIAATKPSRDSPLDDETNTCTFR